MNATLPPTVEDAEIARSAIHALATVQKHAKASRTVSLRSVDPAEKQTVTLPAEAFRLLVEIVNEMANGNAVSIVPMHVEVTTQQAADFLNVSRPFFISLLDMGRPPFRKVGTHRRIRMADLLAYKQRDDEARRKVLDELAAIAQEDALGY
jgi:excisionase family DNA binding protein